MRAIFEPFDGFEISELPREPLGQSPDFSRAGMGSTTVIVLDTNVISELAKP